MSNTFAGVAFVKIDGEQLALRGSLTYSVLGLERESIAGLDGVHGFMEKPKVPFIAGDFSTVPGFSTRKLEGFEGTVTAELRNGTTVALDQARVVGDMEVNPEEGTVSIRWEGLSGREVT